LILVAYLLLWQFFPKGGKKSGPDSWDGLSAELAFSFDEVDFAEGITLTEDEELLASGAVCSFPFMAGDVADVNVLQPGIHGDLTILFQSGDRSGGKVAQLVKGIKSGEMNRRVYPQFALNPGAHFAHSLHLIVLGRDHQIGDF
jgi:hypothetical protein